MRTRQNPENNTWSLNTLMCVNKETVASSLSAAGTREEQGSQLAYCSCPKHLLKGRFTWATRGIGAFQEAPAPSHVAQFVLRKPLSPAVVWRRVLRCGRRCREQSSCPPPAPVLACHRSAPSSPVPLLSFLPVSSRTHSCGDLPRVCLCLAFAQGVCVGRCYYDPAVPGLRALCGVRVMTAAVGGAGRDPHSMALFILGPTVRPTYQGRKKLA